TKRSGIRYEDFTTGTGAGPHETWAPEEATCLRPIHCDWKDVDALILDFLGYAYTVPTGGGGTKLRRYLPEAHSTRAKLYALSVEMGQAIGVPTTSALASDYINFDPGRAFLTVRYSVPPYRVASDADVDGNSNLGERLRYTEMIVKPAVEN